MCIVKFMKGPYNDLSSIYRVLHYVVTEKFTQRHVRYFGGLNVDVSKADDQMILVKQYYHKLDGRQLRHFSVSFENIITPYDAYVIGYQIAAYYARKYQIVFGVHENTENLHIHFMFNSVSFIDGHKCSESYSDLLQFKAYVNEVYRAYINR